MLPLVSLAKRKGLLPCIFILLLVFQIALAEKEPHEESKEDESVIQCYIQVFLQSLTFFSNSIGRTWEQIKTWF